MNSFTRCSLAALVALVVMPASALAVPTAQMGWEPSPGVSGEPMTFQGSNSVPGPGATSITKYEWDFNNDGIFEVSTANSSTTAPPSFNVTGGVKKVRLRVTNNLNQTGVDGPHDILVDQVRARITWPEIATDVDLHVWDAAGNHTGFSSSTPVPNSRASLDERSGEELFLDAGANSGRSLTVGICNFRGGAANVTTRVTRPNGTVQTIGPTNFSAEGAEVIVDQGTFTPPAGWCVKSAAAGAPTPVPAPLPVTPVPPPSNAFSFGPGGGATANADGTVTLNLNAPAPGAFNIAGQSIPKVRIGNRRPQRINVCAASATAAAAGPVKVTLKPTAAARKILLRRSLPTRLTVRFTPTGGTPATQTKTVVFKKRTRR